MEDKLFDKDCKKEMKCNWHKMNTIHFSCFLFLEAALQWIVWKWKDEYMPTSNTCCNWTQAVGQAYAMLFHNCAQSARGIFIMFKRWKSGCQRVGIRRPETTLKHVSNIWDRAFCRPSIEWRQTIFRIRWPQNTRTRMDWHRKSEVTMRIQTMIIVNDMFTVIG